VRASAGSLEDFGTGAVGYGVAGSLAAASVRVLAVILRVDLTPFYLQCPWCASTSAPSSPRLSRRSSASVSGTARPA
jgi:hypothetical protein